MRSSSSQSCQTLDIFNFFGLLTRQSIDADQVGGRIFSRHGRTNFLGLHGNLSIPIIYSGAGFHRGGMRAENIFSPPPLTASTVIRRPVVSYMVNNLCGRRMSTTIAMELWNYMMRRTNIVATRFRVFRIFVSKDRLTTPLKLRLFPRCEIDLA